SAIAHIEGGFKNASRDLVTQIAMQTQFPLPFFTNDPLREFPVQSLLFRARASMTRREAAEACRYAEIIYEIAEMLARKLTAIPVILPTKNADPATAAMQTRLAMQFPHEEPIPHLINAAERLGVLVLALPAALSGRDAFVVWVERDSGPVPLLAISKDRPGDRLRMSVAHELGHLTMRHSPNFDPEQEKEAYAFAAELLMPALAMRREITNPVTLSSIAVLKTRWRVSIQSIIRRAFDLHLISDRQYRYLFEQLSIKGWKTREPINLDIPAEKPRGLKQMAELVYGKPMDYDKIPADLHVGASFFKEVMEGYAEAAGTEERYDDSSVRVIPFAKPARD
ncbi:MAG: ImmA/IrrE family metallo-endopeptidase, partial [Candidatus Acidiferrales bacterium]